MLRSAQAGGGWAAWIVAAVAGYALVGSAPADRQPGLVLRIWEFEGGAAQIPELAGGQLPNVVRIIKGIKLGDGGEPFCDAPDNFISEITGVLRVAEPGAYELRLRSDDGSKLWIGGKLLIDYDGLHAAEPRDAKAELSAGDHELRLRHFQGAGGAALALEWRRSGSEASAFAALPEAALSHEALDDDARKTAPGKKRIIAALRRGLPGDGAPVVGDHPGFARAPGAPGVDKHITGYRKADLLRAVGAAGAKRPAYFFLPIDSLGAVSSVRITEGAYAGQDIVWPEGAAEGWRLFPDELPGRLNGCTLRFNGSGATNVTPSAKPTFEMLGIQSVVGGLMLIFSQPIDARCGWEADSFLIEQWPIDEQGRPMRDGVSYPVKTASVSADSTRVFLETPGLVTGRLIYVRLLPPMLSASGEKLWSTEAWYMLNVSAPDRQGTVRPRPAQPPQNVLTDAEKSEGWKLLFDGKTLSGWQAFGRKPITGWEALDGALVRTGGGGDIVSDEEFDDFELKIDWRISAAGNSGVFYRVRQAPGLRYPWETGPEMQVLDNAEHPDGRSPLTSAGANYALHAPPRDVTRPVGFYNEARIVARGPRVEHWLNGEKLVEYEIGGAAWNQLVAASKFKAMPRYGREKGGSIVLQDHGDRVWYRNIKIRRLGS